MTDSENAGPCLRQTVLFVLLLFSKVPLGDESSADHTSTCGTCLSSRESVAVAGVIDQSARTQYARAGHHESASFRRSSRTRYPHTTRHGFRAAAESLPAIQQSRLSTQRQTARCRHRQPISQSPISLGPSWSSRLQRLVTSVTSRQVGGRYRNRTCNIQFHGLVLYPVELTDIDAVRSEPMFGTHSAKPIRVTGAPLANNINDLA